MRNLKRALSLALAAIMLLGMMVIGTSAAGLDSFKDADKIQHEDAVNVLSAAGIFNGDESGKFNPAKTIDRATMAVMIGKLLYANAEIAKEAYKNLEGGFEDVKGHWAAGWLNMIRSEGIITGVGGNNAGPNDDVNTYQAALMLLRVLGYFRSDSPYENVADALHVMPEAIKRGLFNGLDFQPVASDIPTRDTLAVMVYNTFINCVPVHWDSAVGDYRNNNATINNTENGVVYNYRESLAYQKYRLVYASGDSDPNGRPVTTWGIGQLDNSDIDADGNIRNTYNPKRITRVLTTVKANPIETYTTAVTGRTLYNDLRLSNTTYVALTIDGKDIVQEITENEGRLNETTYEAAVLQIGRTGTANIDTKGISVVLEEGKDAQYITGKGVVTEVYNNPKYDTTKDISITNCPYKVVVINTFALSVASVVEKTEDEPAYVTVGLLKDNSNGTYGGDYAYGAKLNADHVTTGFERDEVVLVTVAYDEDADKYDIQTMDVAEGIPGKLTGYSVTNGIGTLDKIADYPFGKNANRFAHDYGTTDSKVIIYMDAKGYAVDIQPDDETKGTSKYALLCEVDSLKKELFNDNTAGALVYFPSEEDHTPIPVYYTWEKDSVLSYDELYAAAEAACDKNDATNPKPGVPVGTTDDNSTIVYGLRVLVSYTYNATKDLYTLKTVSAVNVNDLTTKNNVSLVQGKVGGTSTDRYLNSDSILIKDTSKSLGKGNEKFDSFFGVREVPSMNNDTRSDTTDKTKWVVNDTNGRFLDVIYTDWTAKAAAEKDPDEHVIYIVKTFDWTEWNYKETANNTGDFIRVIALVDGNLKTNFKLAGVRTGPNNTLELSGTIKKVVEDSVKYGVPFIGKMNDVDGILSNAAEAVEARNGHYLEGQGYVKYQKDTVGLKGTVDGKEVDTYYTLKDGAVFVYIDEARNVSYPVATAMKDYEYEDVTVIFGAPNEKGGGEIEWAIVVKEKAGETPNPEKPEPEPGEVTSVGESRQKVFIITNLKNLKSDKIVSVLESYYNGVKGTVKEVDLDKMLVTVSYGSSTKDVVLTLVINDGNTANIDANTDIEGSVDSDMAIGTTVKDNGDEETVSVEVTISGSVLKDADINVAGGSTLEVKGNVSGNVVADEGEDAESKNKVTIKGNVSGEGSVSAKENTEVTINGTVSKDATVTAEGGNVTIGTLNGTLKVKSDAGDIIIKNIGADAKIEIDEEVSLNAAQKTEDGWKLVDVEDVLDDEDTDNIILFADATVGNSVAKSVGRVDITDVVLDLNGQTLTVDGANFIASGDVTIKNGEIEGKGADTTTVSTTQKCNLTLDGVVLNSEGYAIFPAGIDGGNETSSAAWATTDKTDVVVTIKNKSAIKSSGEGYPAIGTNGLQVKGKITINVDNSTVEGGEGTYGMFLPGVATVNITNGSTIKGFGGIGIKSGTLNITNSTVTASGTGTDWSKVKSQGGNIADTDVAIFIDSNTAYKGEMKITVTGSTLDCAVDEVIKEISGGDYSQVKEITITGSKLDRSKTAEGEAISLVKGATGTAKVTISGTTLNGKSIDKVDDVVKFVEIN